MNRRLVVAAIVLVAFGLGWLLGSRATSNRRPPNTAILTTEAPPDTRSALSVASDSSPCADIRNAAPLIGKRTCVSGVVVRTFTSRNGNTFLDFCQDYRTCPFTSVIFASDSDKFGSLDSLQGRRVEIRGDVVSYQDHAEIILRDPHQLRSVR
jgi:hypothetical protein